MLISPLSSIFFFKYISSIFAIEHNGLSQPFCGSGYASIHKLQNLPIEIISWEDGSFILNHTFTSRRPIFQTSRGLKYSSKNKFTPENKIY